MSGERSMLTSPHAQLRGTFLRMETHTKHRGISLAVWRCTGAGLTVGPTSQDNDVG